MSMIIIIHLLILAKYNKNEVSLHIQLTFDLESCIHSDPGNIVLPAKNSFQHD